MDGKCWLFSELCCCQDSGNVCSSSVLGPEPWLGVSLSAQQAALDASLQGPVASAVCDLGHIGFLLPWFPHLLG